MALVSHLAALRQKLQQDGLDGFLLPMAAPHQAEQVPPSERRIRWLSGFSGSAGFCFILKDAAALFVDGRYETQAHKEVDTHAWEILNISRTRPLQWPKYLSVLSDNPGLRIAYDPWLHSVEEAQKYSNFIPLAENPIDSLWKQNRGQQADAAAKLEHHPLIYSGQRAADKIESLAKAMTTDACLMTSPESVAWLTNTRGFDFPYTPCCNAFALLYRSGRVEMFVKAERISASLSEEEEKPVQIMSYKDFFNTAIHQLKERSIAINPKSCPQFLAQAIEKAGGSIQYENDPCLLPKAIKNAVEIEGAKKAHLLDGVALAHFLSWFEQEACKGNLNEHEASEKINALRRENALCRDLSFPTISAFGANGAIIHYQPPAHNSARIEGDGLFLLDSGGQYREGTTDVTRTVAVGQPSALQKKHYTLVLKGHINLARARFPKGTTGEQLDVLARIFLWREGCDYAHGTGHGVGSYLSVHEAPPSISKGAKVPLECGMIVSNEPGFYWPENYGIRLESLLLVVESKESASAFSEPQLAFETLTLAPFDPRLIEWEQLDREEREWLKQYHRRIYESLKPHVDDEARKYLESLCL